MSRSDRVLADAEAVLRRHSERGKSLTSRARERLGEQDPAAHEIRKLLADHLPELVTGYQSIPAPLRREERNGRVPEKQLIEGLSVIDAEIGRMSEQLASGDLDKLATQNRFLELKYQEAKELGA